MYSPITTVVNRNARLVDDALPPRGDSGLENAASLANAAKPVPRWLPWSVGTLLVLYFVVTVCATLDKSNTYDELPHLTAGYSYWITGSCRLHPENGNLPQRWAALPLLISSPTFPTLEQPAWAGSNAWVLGKQFFFQLDNRAECLLLQGRCMTALFGVAVASLVFCWSRRLFGWKAGFLSLILCVFCPSLLAHGGQITSDMAAAFFFLAGVGVLWWTFHEVSVSSVVISGLVLGGLFLSKFSAIAIVPVAGLLLLLRIGTGRPLKVGARGQHLIQSRLRISETLLGVLLVQALMVWGMIWAGYGFRQTPFADPSSAEEHYWRGWDAVLDGMGFSPEVTDVIQWTRESQLLPDPYLFGFVFTLRYSQARSAFFQGELGTEGWRTFFPFAFLVKTPLPTLLVFGLALLTLGIPKSANDWCELWHGFYRTAPLWIFLAVYWTLAIRSRLNIGHRHILPTYPVMYILAGAAAPWWLKSSSRLHSVVRIALQASLVWLVVENMRIWPHYLAYFNQVVGGPAQGYKYLVDSSLDWGQDLPGLKTWLDERKESLGHVPVYLSYFGTADPAYYQIDAVPLPRKYEALPDRLVNVYRPGVYCISATNLQGVYQRLRPPGEKATSLEHLNYHHALYFANLTTFLRQREPDAEIGYSIMIYILTEHDLERALTFRVPEAKSP